MNYTDQIEFYRTDIPNVYIIAEPDQDVTSLYNMTSESYLVEALSRCGLRNKFMTYAECSDKYTKVENNTRIITDEGMEAAVNEFNKYHVEINGKFFFVIRNITSEQFEAIKKSFTNVLQQKGLIKDKTYSVPVVPQKPPAPKAFKNVTTTSEIDEYIAKRRKEKKENKTGAIGILAIILFVVVTYFLLTGFWTILITWGVGILVIFIIMGLCMPD